MPMVDAAPGTRLRANRQRNPAADADRWRTIRRFGSATSCSISGRAYTGRDAVQHHLMKHEPPVDLRGAVLYHCGPVVVKEGEGGR